jgi:hypothetical protein
MTSIRLDFGPPRDRLNAVIDDGADGNSQKGGKQMSRNTYAGYIEDTIRTTDLHKANVSGSPGMRKTHKPP